MIIPLLSIFDIGSDPTYSGTFRTVDPLTPIALSRYPNVVLKCCVILAVFQPVRASKVNHVC